MSDRLVNAIIDKLKTGSIPNVFLYSDTDTYPAPPYVIVKPESGVRENTRNYRIIVHHNKGMYDELEVYTLVELAELLGFGVTDKDGSRYKLYVSGFTDITAEPSDDTYFMERIYEVPMAF